MQPSTSWPWTLAHRPCSVWLWCPVAVEQLSGSSQPDWTCMPRSLHASSNLYSSTTASTLLLFHTFCKLLISAPSLGVYYILSLTLSVCTSICLSVCHKHCFFFVVSRWNWAISWPSVFHDKNYKTLFFNFWFRPLTPKIYSPKFAKKSPKLSLLCDDSKLVADSLPDWKPVELLT